MAKPKKRKRLPKTTGEWAVLSGDQVIQKVFGKQGRAVLKREAKKEPKPHKDYRLPS
jgi:hypothetical protein